MTMTLTQQQLDMIVDDISRADVEWDENNIGTVYIDTDYDDLHIAIEACFDGHKVYNYIDGWLESTEMELDKYLDAEVCELWLNSNDEIPVEIDMKYINTQLRKIFN